MLVIVCISEILDILYLFLLCHNSFDVCSDVVALKVCRNLQLREGSACECLN